MRICKVFQQNNQFLAPKAKEDIEGIALNFKQALELPIPKLDEIVKRFTIKLDVGLQLCLQ